MIRNYYLVKCNKIPKFHFHWNNNSEKKLQMKIIEFQLFDNKNEGAIIKNQLHSSRRNAFN